MKRSYLATIFLIVLLALVWIYSPVQGKKMTDSKVQLHEIEKACIEYEIIGMPKGKETVYFIDWGNEKLTILDVVMEMGPMKQRTHTANYMKGNKVYTVDLETNKGTVTENPMKSAMSEKQEKQFGEDFMNQFGKEVGTEEFLGKTCRVFEMPSLGSRTLVWKNITLKSVTNLGNMKQSRTAVKIIFEFDKKILNLPTNINFEKGMNLQDIMQEMKGN